MDAFNADPEDGAFDLCIKFTDNAPVLMCAPPPVPKPQHVSVYVKMASELSTRLVISKKKPTLPRLKKNVNADGNISNRIINQHNLAGATDNSPYSFDDNPGIK